MTPVKYGWTLPLAAMAMQGTADAKPKKADKRPNVVMIYVDDLGYGDLSCYGSTLVETPHLDALAAEGVRFTQNYVMAPVSASSRVGLMTGSYPTRFGMDANNGKNFTIDPEFRLMPEAFKQAGYRVGISGKWNVLVDNSEMFDFIKHRINFAANYWPDETGIYNGVDNNKAPNLQNGLWKDGSNGEKYLTDMVFEGAVEFVNQNHGQEEPFFLYVAPNAPHYPLQAHTRYWEKTRNIENPAYRMYAAMIMAMDDGVGALCNALRRTGQWDNTIICFASDNGPSSASGPTNKEAGAGGKSWFWPEGWPTGLTFHSTNGLRGGKGQLYEGGIRLPLIIHYPKVIEGGRVCDTPVAIMDLYPTFCALAGIEVPQGTHLDGCDISNVITGQSTDAPHDYIFWKIRDQGAVRHGDWKLYFNKKGCSLFNIREDAVETNDLAGEKPEMTAELKKKWDQWYAAYAPVFVIDTTPKKKK